MAEQGVKQDCQKAVRSESRGPSESDMTLLDFEVKQNM